MNIIAPAMKRSQRYLLLFLLLLPSSSWAADPYKAVPIPQFKNKQEKDDYYFRKGRVLVNGNYQGRAVFAKMVGLVSSPPEKVWQLYISPNEWTRARMPSLKDARTVPESVVQQVAETKEVARFYQAVGSSRVGGETGRVKGGRWGSYTFQYYNVPWPISDRWMIVKDSRDETRAAEGIYRSEWSKAAGNVKTISGYILLEPFEGDRNVTKMEYRTLSDPDVAVPRFLLKWGIDRVMPGVIEAIRNYLRSDAINLKAS